MTRRRTRALAAVAAAVVLGGCGSTVPLGQGGSGGLGGSAAGTAAGGAGATTAGALGGPGEAGTAAVSGPGGGAAGTTASGPAGGATGGRGASAAGSTGGASGAAPLPPIKIDYTMWDTAGFTAITGASGANASSTNLADDQKEMNALVAYANATGGVGGRTIAPPVGIKISTTDALNQQTLDAYCAQATEDDHAMAYIDRSFLVSDESIQCFAKHHTTLVSNLPETSESTFRAVAPYAATTSQSVDRSAQALVAGLPQSDYLAGATVGVLVDDLPGTRYAYDHILAPGLAADGAKVKDVVYVNGTDSSQQSGQASAAVLKFHTEGIDHVVFFAGFLALLGFTNNADSQHYYPRYAYNDYADTVGDAGFYVSPTQNARAIAVSALPSYVLAPGTDGASRSLQTDVNPNDPNVTPGTKNCLDILTKYTHENYYSGQTSRSTEYAFYCDNFLLWLAAARKVGAGVTPASWGTGLAALGGSYASSFTHDTDFSHRYDGSSDYQIGIYSSNASCKCFVASIRRWTPF